MFVLLILVSSEDLKRFFYVYLCALKRRCFSGNAVADLPEEGIVDVPLAQTGEGIAECELLQWFVKEVRDPRGLASVFLFPL